MTDTSKITPSRRAADSTMLLTQNDLLSMCSWKKVEFFPNLPKVSRQEAQLFKSLEWLFPAFAEPFEMLEAIAQTLKNCLQSEDVQLTFDYFQVVPVSALPSCVAEPTFLAVLSFRPYQPRGFWEIELGFAHKAVELLLGANSESVEIRALTELEEGILQFLALQVLRTMFVNAGAGKVHVRLDNIFSSSKAVMPLMASETHMVLMSLSASVDGHKGCFRFFIPATVLSKLQPHADAPVRAYRMQQNLIRAKDRLALPNLSLRVEIGHAEIPKAEYEGLRPGATVLLDKLTLRPDKRADGSAELRIGAGFSGHLDCQLGFDGRGYKAEVEKITLGTVSESLDHNLSDRGKRKGEIMDPNQLSAAPLLSDVPLRLVVELARIPVTIEEVVEMKVGHVIDLGRLASDPLNLVVNGKTVGQGELVEFDGQLGIRLIAVEGS
ncbi:MAG: FliM/FliN family flagellar motor switch protein [Cystobacterineae bacterium]|nr:FliM/FliN family flagellar motor switch protein [Cystobacterineae bacterium]